MTIRDLSEKQLKQLRKTCFEQWRERCKLKEFDWKDYQTIFSDGVRAALRIMLPNG